MSLQDKLLAQRIYLILASLFICSLVVSNLIFQKFFYWYPFGDFEIFGTKLFQISVGIIPYPITFLITDIISEIYGKKRANQVVTTGIFASVFSLGIIYIANAVPAIENSPVTDPLFTKVFGQTALAVIASMLAYLFAQYIDIQVYHFWKKATKGKRLWVRNNFSTMTSQAIDTLSVLFLLCAFKILPWDLFIPLFISGFLFKVFIALIDTPFMYLAVYYFRKRFLLKINEELHID
ncbi:queuosine precursor transporter [Flavobacterium jejuense]|uniref:Probable queuosine precursor transporter n=1 Tax=Flavobacterium jejuense TaxID=1544455 RepID=A0ABX0IX19_9FLAO|nr:queuosine precursor transporter [Flavobacterium jejuense]NHN26325.1 queuosine precursor transporter [Flavobacterium jejuense]